MLFNLNIKFVKDPVLDKQKLMYIKFFLSGENLGDESEDFLKKNNIRFNNHAYQNFISKKEVKELKLYNENSHPDILLMRKFQIDKKFNSDFFRSELSALLSSLENSGIENIQIDLPAYKLFGDKFVDEYQFVSSLVEGVFLGNYSFSYKSEIKKKQKLNIYFSSSSNKFNVNELNEITNLFKGVYAARDLVNEPANVINPQTFVERIKILFRNSKVKLQIFNKRELENMKMNAVLAVGGASNHSPVFLVLNYKPAKTKLKKIALVGKGVTYDSGGLSIKPTSGMLDMKADMAGAAAVVGTVFSAMKNNLPIELFGVIPLVENMLSGNSYKPGDIIKSYSGKTIEVKDTDAEGRLILADALTYAGNLKPDMIIDYATLTGACVVALGEIAAGVFSLHQDLTDKLILAGNYTFERLWQLPMWSDYNSLLDSKIADISNLGPRWGGAITAAKFLEFFVDENIPWAHIDLAGPAVKHKENSYSENYDTGFGVRLTYRFLERLLAE